MNSKVPGLRWNVYLFSRWLLGSACLQPIASGYPQPRYMYAGGSHGYPRRKVGKYG